MAPSERQGQGTREVPLVLEPESAFLGELGNPAPADFLPPCSPTKTLPAPQGGGPQSLLLFINRLPEGKAKKDWPGEEGRSGRHPAGVI